MAAPCSPTSPAGTEASEPPSPLGDGDGEALGAETEVAARLDGTEAVNRAVPGAALASSGAAPRPVLLVGPRFDKEYPLNPNRWVKIGRSKKAQLMLNNASVSRTHCSLRWDKHRRVVELKDTSMAGTQVNGETIKSERNALAHADRLRIEGKRIRFEFLLDLRPVGLGFNDPREEQKGLQSLKKLRGPALIQWRDNLRNQLANLTAEVQKREKEAFEKEREFHDIAMRRGLRLKEDKQRQEDLEKYTAGKKALEEKLEESRKQWLDKMSADSEKNEGEVKPIMDAVAERQVKLEKLQLKKDELERTIHPERYAVADVSRVGNYSIELPTPQKTPSAGVPSRANSEPPALDDVDAEEDAFANLLSGIPGQQAGEGPRLMEAGQLESSSADEPDAKRPKVEGAELTVKPTVITS
uniref:FHA domain-containing protein n=1 Tax=Alexandrium monilatum TaxID=311494 RepID=A0A7S4SW95_9DINO